MHLGCMTTLAIGSNDPGSAACAASPRLNAASPTTTIKGTRMRIGSSSSRPQAVRLQWQLPDSLAGGREDRVGDRRRRDRRAWLADPAWRLGAPHQMHFDGRRLIDPHHADVMEIGLLHAAV